MLGNQLCGQMSASLGDLRCLTFLFSHQSNLSGSVPPEIGKFSNLLNFTWIPIIYQDTSLITSTKLIMFFMYQNQLSAPSPDEI